MRPHDADAFGRALLDWARGGTDPEIIEREDGMVDTGAGHEVYLAGVRQWPAAERRAVKLVAGRVLDAGCGAGRVALHLQDRGHEVVGVDASPLAVRAARLRGVGEVWCSPLERLDEEIAGFDTIVLFGNNFGIRGTPARTRRLLRGWARHARPGTRILAESTNPYCGGAPALDRAYYRRNVARGRMPGQVRVRTVYQRWATPWFDWLFVSRRDMRAVLAGTGWHQHRVLGTTPVEPYVAVLERD
ncbi:MAG TPA: class I SAM-dependent methyltransferase [Acidimicrobiales bacterium]|nr:class I SAM-dependent methyltransferase [Acidimicrobiales bacterium]